MRIEKKRTERKKKKDRKEQKRKQKTENKHRLQNDWKQGPPKHTASDGVVFPGISSNSLSTWKVEKQETDKMSFILLCVPVNDLFTQNSKCG